MGRRELGKSLRTHKDLEVWREAMDLAKEVYSLTANFPEEELYGLTSQIRRSAVSIPSNIAEGAGRGTNKEFLQFLYFSLGSLSELETQLLLAKELCYLETTNNIFERIEKTRRLLLGLIKFLKNN